ncbi:hypothetical protein [Clostridioides sp. ES-S-0048-02]|uniref:hypothetical protein n=1 Tax=Clostridioides sp. ES-S-0048-02 TaxID=2770777 RepID=UPI001D0F687C|nr:hypothetical protein [Clostridioides sp. ES-S-0048-02]
MTSICFIVSFIGAIISIIFLLKYQNTEKEVKIRKRVSLFCIIMALLMIISRFI